MSTPTDLFPGFTTPPTDPSRDLRAPEPKPTPAPAAPNPRHENFVFSREYYVTRCQQHWDREPLRNAIGNWRTWREIHEALRQAMKEYLAADNAMTLKPFLWKLQNRMNPHSSGLHPLLDFEEHYQKIFLRRGLIIYCEMIIAQLEIQQAARKISA